MTGFMIVLLDCNCVEKVDWGAFEQLFYDDRLSCYSFLICLHSVEFRVRCC